MGRNDGGAGRCRYNRLSPFDFRNFQSKAAQRSIWRLKMFTVEIKRLLYKTVGFINENYNVF